MPDGRPGTTPPAPIEAIGRARRMIREAELEIAMNPADVTDAIRAEVEAIPLVTLRESRIVKAGTAYVIRPATLEEFRG